MACSLRPVSPNRLATSELGSSAKAPIESMPQRSRVAVTSAAGARRWSGRGARNSASLPAATQVGEPGSEAATRAGQLARGNADSHRQAGPIEPLHQVERQVVLGAMRPFGCGRIA